MKPIMAASLMCIDYLHVKDNMEAINRHCDILHADVLDGHFRKNVTLSPDFVKVVRGLSDLPMDIHLMVTNPLDFIDIFSDCGATYMSVHFETIAGQETEVFDKIRSNGFKTGMVVNPETSLEQFAPWLPHIDLLTIMTVHPGFAGSPFVWEAVDKLRAAADIIQENGYPCIIQADGSINKNTYKPLWEAGSRMFVMGSTGLFGLNDDLDKAGLQMKQEIVEATDRKSVV